MTAPGAAPQGDTCCRRAWDAAVTACRQLAAMFPRLTAHARISGLVLGPPPAAARGHQCCRAAWDAAVNTCRALVDTQTPEQADGNMGALLLRTGPGARAAEAQLRRRPRTGPPVVYVAGPYRGATPVQVHGHIMAARAVAERLVCEGLGVVCPHLNTAWMDGLQPDHWFLDMTLELLRRCDAVVLVTGWEHSAGALAEVAEAHALGIPVYTDAIEAVAGLRRPGSDDDIEIAV